MRLIKSEQRAVIIAIVRPGSLCTASDNDRRVIAVTEQVARIVILFLSSIALQVAVILAWRLAESTMIQAQTYAAYFNAGVGLFVYLAGAMVCWLLLKRLPYLGG